MHTDVQSIKMNGLQMDGKQTQAESAPSHASIRQSGTDRAQPCMGSGVSALMLLCAYVGYDRKELRLCVGKGCALRGLAATTSSYQMKEKS